MLKVRVVSVLTELNVFVCIHSLQLQKKVELGAHLEESYCYDIQSLIMRFFQQAAAQELQLTLLKPETTKARTDSD